VVVAYGVRRHGQIPGVVCRVRVVLLRRPGHKPGCPLACRARRHLVPLLNIRGAKAVGDSSILLGSWSSRRSSIYADARERVQDACSCRMCPETRSM
jgi:hypothetical protein